MRWERPAVHEEHSTAVVRNQRPERPVLLAKETNPTDGHGNPQFSSPQALPRNSAPPQVLLAVWCDTSQPFAVDPSHEEKPLLHAVNVHVPVEQVSTAFGID